MKIRTFGYIFSEALISLRRNAWMGLASMGTVAVSLIIVGVSLLLVINTNTLAANIESNVEITVFIKDEVELDAAQRLEQKILAVPGIKDLEFIPKDKALVEFRKQLGENSRMVNALGGDNPLPHSYRVTTVDPQKVKEVAGKIEKISGVEKVNYGQGIVERLFLVTKWARAVGIALIVLLGLAAVFLIATTIRLTVFARRKEIQIMKIIGATNWFIRWPFLVEGMILGFVGALVAVIIVGTSYVAFVDYLQQDLAFMGFRADTQFLIKLSLMLLGTGMGLGALGSGISMRKFLKV